MTAVAAGRWSSLRLPLLTGAAAAGGAAALVVRDPHQQGSWLFCPILRFTGVPCPGCGGLRATHDLLTGDIAAALSSNAYVVASIVLATIGYAAWLPSAVRGRRPRWAEHLPVVMSVWAVGLLAFGALRLLPPLSVLRP